MKLWYYSSWIDLKLAAKFAFWRKRKSSFNGSVAVNIWIKLKPSLFMRVQLVGFCCIVDVLIPFWYVFSFFFFPDEFKPASIDRSQPGSLHKSRDNRVTVEFQNNQHGKPKVIFEGVGEDYRDKDNDAVLLFDGETCRLERLHQAVKRLRHVRIPGEPSAAAASTMTTLVTPVVESHSTTVSKGSKLQPVSSGIVHEKVSLKIFKYISMWRVIL